MAGLTRRRTVALGTFLLIVVSVSGVAEPVEAQRGRQSTALPGSWVCLGPKHVVEPRQAVELTITENGESFLVKQVLHVGESVQAGSMKEWPAMLTNGVLVVAGRHHLAVDLETDTLLCKPAVKGSGPRPDRTWWGLRFCGFCSNKRLVRGRAEQVLGELAGASSHAPAPPAAGGH